MVTEVHLTSQSAENWESSSVNADAIYFLMSPGWKKEMRSNRWHYATRWAHSLPVVLVQPVADMPIDNICSEIEPRIENCRILYVRAFHEHADSLFDGVAQAEQIRQDIKRKGYKRVLLWMYNPNYVVGWELVPAVGRIYHATENHFEYTNNSPDFEARLRACLRSADAVICCSEGVANSYSQHTRGKVLTLTNGCDYKFYASGKSDRELAVLGENYAKIVVYAGNLDDRLDYDMMFKAARKNPNFLFALYGRTNFTRPVNETAWSKLKQLSNVCHLGLVPPEKLPDIYAAGDVGLAPYMADPLLKRNTIPLKVFEMIAAKLPVVATNLDMLRPFQTKGLAVVDTTEDFVATVHTTASSTLSQQDQIELEKLGRGQDYDVKFEKARELVRRVAADREVSATLVERRYKIAGAGPDHDQRFDFPETFVYLDDFVQFENFLEIPRRENESEDEIERRISERVISTLMRGIYYYVWKNLPLNVKNFIKAHFAERLKKCVRL